jgi:hypothetical protein
MVRELPPILIGLTSNASPFHYGEKLGAPKIDGGVGLKYNDDSVSRVSSRLIYTFSR